MKVEELFQNKDTVVKEIYEKILEMAEGFGPVVIEPKKTSIHLKNKSAFGGVHPKKKCVEFNVVLSRRTDDDRIKKIERVSANRFHHYFRFESASQIDESFIQLMKESYSLLG
jgi:hypothetical protein